MISRAMGARKPGPQGERDISVKTIAQGRPDDPVDPVVTAACFFCCRRAMGVDRHPAFSAPSVLSRVMSSTARASYAARTRSRVSERNVIASEAIQTFAAAGLWIASSLTRLAMTPGLPRRRHALVVAAGRRDRHAAVGIFVQLVAQGADGDAE